MTPDARAELLLSFAHGPARLQEALAACPEESLDFKPAPGKWSVRDIVWHMAESELHGYCRGRFILSEPGVTIMPYDQDRWADTLDAAAHPLEEALELFRLLRELMARQLRSQPEARWKQTINHPVKGAMDLERWIGIYDEHLKVHVAQIHRTVEAWKACGVGR